MTHSLDRWQEQMERHFAALAKSRKHSDMPLFVLEHGLGSTEINEIGSQLKARLNRGERLAPHWLLWAIYAAEQGYIYEGHEFWQSFEQSTPGWESSDRYRISDWFLRFHKNYNGFRPTGPWASHFSIIAWPITHAVLPRYLQRQFAQSLYALRFQLARIEDASPSMLGRMIASNAYGVSTRFEQFLEQEELVGRIVLALFQQTQEADNEILLPATLNRIVNDLESIRNARGWLRETKRVVAVRFKGLGKRPSTKNTPGRTTQETASKPDIRPDLRLHYRGQKLWDLQIDIPSFKDVAALNPEIRKFLKQTRCTLNGSKVRKPPGWLLSGRRQAILREWPSTEKPLVDFEKENGTISHLLESECRMTNGPVWLFRIGRDGIAREIAGHVVRPGYQYVIAAKEVFERPDSGAEACSINCPDIHSLQIAVPTSPNEKYEAWLKAIGLELAKTIQVWPAGFPGRQWDGEGRGEWLTTDTPSFGIKADHLVEAFEITLNGKESLRVEANSDGSPTFVQLSQLPVGRHLLVIRAQRGGKFDDRQPSHEGFLELRVREPDPWVPGTASHAGLVVWADPYDASLSDFWENEFKLSVFGPASRQIVPRVVLNNASEETIFDKQVCGPLELPLEPEIWKERFSNFLRRENCALRYLDAASGTLELDGDELGRYVMRFEHELRPLRWALHDQDGNMVARLVDETADEDAHRKCYFLSMDRPLASKVLTVEEAKRGLRVEPPGGMFVAIAGRNRDAVVVSAGLTGGGLEGLGAHPDHGHLSEAPREIARLFGVLSFWHKARLAGGLASARRRQVTDVINSGIIGVLVGWDWARTEARLKASPDQGQLLGRLQAMVADHRSFATAIRFNASSVADDRKALQAWFVDLSVRYGLSSDERLCQFAIDFAVCPHAVRAIYKDALPELVDNARSHQSLFRGARFAMLCKRAALKESRPQSSQVTA